MRVRGDFESGLLTYHLCAALGREEWFDPLVPQIEADLEKLAANVNRLDELISAFRRKLSNDNCNPDVMPSPVNDPANPSVVGSTRIDQAPVRPTHWYVPLMLSIWPSWTGVPRHVHGLCESLEVSIVNVEPSSLMLSVRSVRPISA